jgi:hypothetical protein
MAVVTRCLALKCPSTAATARLREVLLSAPHLSPDILPFINRQGDNYGVYVIRGGTEPLLKRLGLHVQSLELASSCITTSKNNKLMYELLCGTPCPAV